MAITLAPVGAAALPAVLVTFALDLAVLGGVWLALRPGRADIRSKEDFDRAIHAGRPVVVELYSNFCLICLSNRQAIKLAAASLGGAARFVRLELPTKAGTAIGDAYGARYTPSYLVFDEHGDLVRTIVPENVTPLANGYRVLDDKGAIVSRAERVTPDLLVGLVRRAA